MLGLGDIVPFPSNHSNSCLNSPYMVRGLGGFSIPRIWFVSEVRFKVRITVIRTTLFVFGVIKVGMLSWYVAFSNPGI